MEIRITKSGSTGLTILSILVTAVGAIAVAIAAAHRVTSGEHAWLIMVALALLIAPVSTIKIPGVKADIVLGDVVTFTCAVLFGPSAAVIAAVADGAVTSLRLTKSPGKYFYNVAVCAVSMAGSAYAARLVFPGFGQGAAALSRVEIIAALGLFTFAYFIISTLLVAAHISFSNGTNLIRLWSESFLWTSISYVASGAAALAAALLVGRIGFFVVPVIIGVMALAFAFYRTYFTRVERADLMAEGMEKLNYSAIEILAAAIGAAGSSVRPNLRRTDRLASELGRLAGCSPEELKALKVAALLHDVGNMVIPHQILEKPTSLSESEFNRMKRHAAVGASIVQAIGFPYPAAEIIRHHHERFDGSGYPDCLRGAEIPLGARVLIIVDCYDALTSDRPYRSRFKRDQALGIMKESRGQSFDPILFDKFLGMVQAADEEACKAQSEAVLVEELRTEILSQTRIFDAA